MQTENPWISLLGMIVAVAVVTVLAYWFTRHVIGGNRIQSLGLLQKNGQLQILAQTQIGKEQRLAVVQVGTRYFVVGITTQNISMLAELSKEEASVWQNCQEEGSAPTPPFHQALIDAFQKRKKR